MNREIIVTEDGSHSLFDKDMGETFHSKNRAVQEYAHVYIKNDIALINKENINVLKYDIETGLNVLLTLDISVKIYKKIVYESIEAYPLTKSEFKLLNYNDFVKTPVSLQKLHEIPVDINEMVTEQFSLLKHFCKIEDFNTSNKFDIVYFDVFGFDYQSELWSQEILQKSYDFLNANGIFLTYACKGLINLLLK